MANLPDEIILIILSRLPVKSVLRFKAVSRSWKTMISDHGFLRMHLQQSKLLPDSYNFFVRKPACYPFPLTRVDADVARPFSLVRVEDGKFRFIADLGCPRGGPWETVLCTCEGVMLLIGFSRRAYMLWNPFTRNETLLRFPYKFYYTLMHGICYDPITMDDLKVVVVSNDHYAVYSCKSESWSEKKIFPFSLTGIRQCTGIFADGVVYWVAYREYSESREIIYFDPRDDDFKTLPKPEHVGESDLFDLVCLRGCLSLYRETGNHVRIWIKEKGGPIYSWNELMIIENVYRLRTMEWFKPLCLVGNNNIVICLDGARFVVYNPCVKAFRQFKETEEWRLAPCLQSLLFHSTT